jgi:uncharacterized protein YjbK
MEVELKLLLEPAEVSRLRRALGTPQKSIVQYNRYLDDEDRTLARNGWGLRIRLEIARGGASRVVLTLKHSGEQLGDFTVRPEYETALNSAGIEPVEAVERARALLPDPGVLPQVEPVEVARLENHRDVYGLPLHEECAIEIDHTVWPDGTESDELELEVSEGVDRTAAERALRFLLESCRIPWRVGQESKLERLLGML